MTEIEAFILIGGRSSRLGTDKAFVDVRGKTLAQRSIDVVQLSFPGGRTTMVAGSSLQFAIQAIVSDVLFIFDLHAGRGPVGGLHAALAYAQTPWIFVLACDYPFVSADLIRLVGNRVEDEFGAVVPQQEDSRLQPLCAFYKVDAARPIVEAIIERPRLPPPMHEIVSELNPAIVPFQEYSHLPDADSFFININTPDDLERARSEDGKLSGKK